MANITKIEELEGGTNKKYTIRGKVTYKSDKLTTNNSNRFEFSLYDGHYLRCVLFSNNYPSKYEELFNLIQAGKYYTIQNALVTVNKYGNYCHLQIRLNPNSDITLYEAELNITPHADIIKVSDVMGLDFGKPSSRTISTVGSIISIHEPKIDITDENNKISVVIRNKDLWSKKIFNVGDKVVVENCLLTKYNDELEVNVGEMHSELTIIPNWINGTALFIEEQKKETCSSPVSQEDYNSYLQDARKELQDARKELQDVENKIKDIRNKLERLDL